MVTRLYKTQDERTGSHILERSRHFSQLVEPILVLILGIDLLGQSKIEKLDTIVDIESDVLRLAISKQNAVKGRVGL